MTKQMNNITTELLIKAFSEIIYLKDFIGTIQVDNELHFIYRDVKITIRQYDDTLLNAHADGHITFLQMKYIVKIVNTIEETLEIMKRNEGEQNEVK